MKVIVAPPAGIGVIPNSKEVVRLGVNTNSPTVANIANAAANSVAVYANGVLVLSNANLNFNNTSTINVFATANGTGQVNVQFVANLTSTSAANAAYAQANAAYDEANNAYALASNAVIAVNGTIQVTTIDLLAANITSISGTTTANAIPVIIDTFPTAMYTCADYTVQLQTINSLHLTRILGMQDGVNAYMTEYATLTSNASLGTFNIILSGTNVQLLYTPKNPLAQIITFNVLRNSLIN